MHLISGIQQLGVGVVNADVAFAWYRTHFGAGVKVFADRAVADRMGPYTQHEARERYAILALNMRGGGGFEIWQYTERTPQPPAFTPEVGDLGIFAGKLKCVDAHVARHFLLRRGADLLGEVTERADATASFWVRDLYGNPYEVVETPAHFTQRRHPIGGVYGAVIGVSDVQASKAFYAQVLGYDQVVLDTTEPGALAYLPGGDGRAVRRVVLRAGAPRRGAFAPLLGPAEIELVHAPGYAARKIFAGRDWGDQGFIHLCFDVRGMDDLKAAAADYGAPFTVDSGVDSFDMGEAAGRFAYCEDPDGALVEFVETHKLPILKKPAFSLDLRGRDPEKPLPRVMLRALGW